MVPLSCDGSFVSPFLLEKRLLEGGGRLWGGLSDKQRVMGILQWPLPGDRGECELVCVFCVHGGRSQISAAVGGNWVCVTLGLRWGREAAS